MDDDEQRRFCELPEEWSEKVRGGRLRVHKAWAVWWFERRQLRGLAAAALGEALLAEAIPAAEAYTSDSPRDDPAVHFARVVAREFRSDPDGTRVRVVD